MGDSFLIDEILLLRFGVAAFAVGLLVHGINLFVTGKDGNILARLISTTLEMTGLMGAVLGAIGCFLGVKIMIMVSPLGVLILAWGVLVIWKRDFPAVLKRRK